MKTKGKSDNTQVFITEHSVEILCGLGGICWGWTGHSDYCGFPKSIFKKPPSLHLDSCSQNPLQILQRGPEQDSHQKANGLQVCSCCCLIIVILRFDILSCHSFYCKTPKIHAQLKINAQWSHFLCLTGSCQTHWEFWFLRLSAAW